MASNLPAALRAADIGRFAQRAAQIDKAKPVVAYWCNYHIVNQIIEKGLHTADNETKLYTTNLVEKMEQFKNENPDNETVTDGVAANAYVEQFGLEIFNRAEAAMTANKVTKQTADTFQAASTFLELCQIWGDLDPEIAGRIKFAKYHAVRIVKAIKAGEDPNASNPAPKKEAEEVLVADPEVQAFDESVAEQAGKPRQASVEEIPDDSDRLGRQMAHQSSIDESLHPSRTSSAPRQPASSELDIPSVPQNAPGSPRQRMDIDQSQPGGLELPSTPGQIGGSSSIPNLPDTPGFSHAPAPLAPNSFQSFPSPSADSPMPAPDPASFYQSSSASAYIPPPASSAGPPPAAQVLVAPAPVTTSQPSHSVDDNSISLAQKHARWAVSAMTFDDVDTAIKELRTSLRYLGAE
ncbi:Vacuolar protein sorting-associate Vta1 N-terminal [Penicillium capsulatum]|uniref:Vacuolar protein sorting-associate Vta1 N-terminal n=1 Tax=Penicillium capsulatum TaxID=69766 RepID=A0A9W9IJA8_9EURO|nr:Vacuolar protein sorting-associate Vta1 N-terminal [Penicillium capsulatum]KAJ6123021.1 Vacuolar protein sorting-associate Vta1 N-terminal [Penicillium capsulatum]